MISAPLVTRPVRSSQSAEPALSTSTPLSTGSVEGARPEAPADAAQTAEPSLDERIDAALAEALAKVKTPADDEVAKQQQAFDQMMQLRTEQEREANAIREFGIAQQKKENDFLTEYIRMI
jgi:hypothetical protein